VVVVPALGKQHLADPPVLDRFGGALEVRA
jgi:hypothetical protein